MGGHHDLTRRRALAAAGSSLFFALAVTTAILGQALLLGRPVLLAWATVVGLANAAFVHWYEEPTLHRQFGAEYDTYRGEVPAWLPRRRPWSGPGPDVTAAT